jgi:hypothetical protein
MQECGWNYLATMCYVAASGSATVVLEELVKPFSYLSIALLLAYLIV